MMEKLSAKEFDLNFCAVSEKFNIALQKSGRKREEVILLAATKTVDYESINYAIKKGISHIGENKVQELLSKNDAVDPAHRHFIGHLQTNKVKDIIDEVEMIQSVHSVKLAKEINRLAEQRNKVMDILCEVNIGNEESKSGFSSDEIFEKIEEISRFPFVRVKGLMTIPPISENSDESARYFAKMQKLFIDIKGKKVDNVSMVYLSMGMSDDYEQAIGYGANIVRIGTSLFGHRDYGNK